MTTVKSPKRSYVFIGPLAGSKPSGLSIPFVELKDYLDLYDCDLRFIDSNSENYRYKFQMLLEIYLRVIFSKRGSHISLHGSLSDFKYIPPALLVRHFLNGGDFSLRKFAGSFYRDFERINVIYRFFISRALRLSTANFFETKNNLQKFQHYNESTYLFPNTRRQSEFVASPPAEGMPLKILYLGRVISEKGLRDLVEACQNSDDVSLTIIGRAEEESLEGFLNKSSLTINRITDLHREEVYQTIAGHHCLALPSYYPSEGIPGAVLEAFMCGLPVVVSNHNELPDLCQDAGEICEIRDPYSIQQAIVKIRQSWREKHKCALSRGKIFQSDVVFESCLATLGMFRDEGSNE